MLCFTRLHVLSGFLKKCFSLWLNIFTLRGCEGPAVNMHEEEANLDCSVSVTRACCANHACTCKYKEVK